jgi:carboxyl-terminal processing protease
MERHRQRTTMKYRGLSIFLIAVLLTMACQAVTGAFSTPTGPVATATRGAPPPPATPEPGASPTAVPVFNDAGVRYCYFVPGTSVPAVMPPEVLATPTPIVYPTPVAPENSQVDGATTEAQLKVFDQLWQDVDDNYVYPDFNGHDWKAIGDKYEAVVKAGLTNEGFYLAMDQMMFELGDEHSRFISPEQAEEEDQDIAGQQNFVGIGALVQPLDAEGTSGVIVSLFPGSPAAEAGLRLHDKVGAVDGGPWLDPDTGKSRTLGPEGTEVTVTIQTPGEDPRDITFTRRAVTGSVPIDYCIVPGTRVGYIYLPTFEDQTIDDQVHDALEKMTSDGPLDGLILDNRMNSGGLNAVGERILSYFISGGNGQYVSRHGSRALDIEGEDINGSQSVPLVLLVDLETASMGEIFSGVLRVSERAKVVGQNTLGNVETLHQFNYDDSSRAWIASESFEPVGQANGIWERTGIIPDVYAPTRWDLFTEATDPALAKAIALLQGNP